jgi:hypothetical protein
MERCKLRRDALAKSFKCKRRRISAPRPDLPVNNKKTELSFTNSKTPRAERRR